MGLTDRVGKKLLLKLPDLKLISLARESMPYISVKADGLSFFFGSNDHSILDYMVVNKSIWSKDEMDFILGYYNNCKVCPGSVIDIGANVGTSIVYFRSMIGEDAHYYALEPVTENYNLLNANCAINGFVDINTYKLGISDTEGDSRMEINPGNMATCKIAGSDSARLVYKEDESSYIGETASFTTIDSFVSNNGIDKGSPILFWIDVEGHEPEVFRSGKETFKKSDSLVFCEFNPKLYKYNGRYDTFIQDIKECFSKFICYEQYEAGAYEFRPIDEIEKVADENSLNQCNLLLVK